MELSLFKYMIPRMKKLLVFLPLLLTQQAFAARPFVTDDARLTTAGSCQLEAWTRVYQHSHELWALPACNPWGNFELTFGGSSAKADGQRASLDSALQAKTLFRALKTNDWGIGVAFGKISHDGLSPGPNQYGNTYGYVPISWSLWDDDIILHANFGILHDKQSKQNNMTWGLGSEIRVKPNLLGIAEIYGDNRNNPYLQVGFRYSVIPNLFQIDSTYGQQINGDSELKWISFGLRYTPEKLF
ncbi:conserved exported protein of unknown function [Candidatus Methylopumilus turicensis]|uniref:Uncharacterized protein n=2 Tax=Candidatus Methylopumilus turicensis TaxID=1581680 RepID=A0A0B7IU94_9PROT|nr:conserved exported protein of unknown function [Candidatus Methylopumilus turicensis]